MGIFAAARSFAIEALKRWKLVALGVALAALATAAFMLSSARVDAEQQRAKAQVYQHAAEVTAEALRMQIENDKLNRKLLQQTNEKIAAIDAQTGRAVGEIRRLNEDISTEYGKCAKITYPVELQDQLRAMLDGIVIDDGEPN